MVPVMKSPSLIAGTGLEHQLALPVGACVVTKRLASHPFPAFPPLPAPRLGTGLAYFRIPPWFSNGIGIQAVGTDPSHRKAVSRNRAAFGGSSFSRRN